MNDDESWRLLALCAHVEYRDLPWLEWTEKEPRGARRQLAKQQMRLVCGSCPVMSDCRDYAETRHVTAGVWAGRSYRREEKREH